MPQVGAGIAAAAGALASTAVGSALLQVGAGMALSALGRAIAPREPGRVDPGMTIEFTAGEAVPLSIALGHCAVGGWALGPAYSSSYGEGGAPNKFLNRAVLLSDLPIASFEGVIVDGKLVRFEDFDENNKGNDAIGALDGKVWAAPFRGFHVSAAPNMRLHYGSRSTRPWEASMVGRGVAYVVMTYKADRDVWPGEPQPTYIVKGAWLYDPRKDSTAGGSGSQRWGTPSTWAYTENPMVMVYNLRRGITIPDVGVYGWRYEPEQLPYASWAAAMNVCDEATPLEGGGTEKRYRAGLNLRLDSEPFEAEAELLKACGGHVVDCGGVCYASAGPPPPPVAWITDGDVISTDGRDFTPFRGLAETFNGVEATYPSPEDGWETRAAEPYRRTDWEAEDDGRRLPAQMSFAAVPYGTQVRRLMREAAEDHRRFRTHSIPLGPRYEHLLPLQTIAWTSAENGYLNKLFEIVTKSVDPLTGNSRLLIRERDPQDYNPDAFLDNVLPTPLDVTPDDGAIVGVPGFLAQGWALKDAEGRDRRPAIRLSWTPQEKSSSFLGIDVEVWLVQNGTRLRLIASKRIPNVTAGEDFIVDGILPNTDFAVRAEAVANGVATIPSGWQNIRTPDVRLGSYDIIVDNLTVNGWASFGGAEIRSDNYPPDGWILRRDGTAYFGGTVIAGRFVTTDNIVLGAVNTKGIAISTADFRIDNADEVGQQVSIVSTGAWTEITITLEYWGERLLSNQYLGRAEIRLRRDSTTVAEFNLESERDSDRAEWTTISFVDQNPGTGSKLYYLSCNPRSGGDLYLGYRMLAIKEVKR